jgi:hypothetical protein
MDSCEHGNEHSESMKGGKFSGLPERILPAQKRFLFHSSYY